VSRSAVLLLALAVVAGCGSDDSSDESSGESANTVEVVASDFRFEPSALSVDSAGPTTFRLTNEGGTTHALEFEGGGLVAETAAIGPGESADVTVDLQAGQYEIYCPVGDHRSLGMEGTLVVAGGSAAGGGGTTTDDDDPYGG
jgi:plastocyanin